MPDEVLMKKSTTEAAQKVVELVGGIQDLVVAGDLLNIVEGAQREDVPYSEANALEATRDNTYSHNISDNVIEIESTSTSTSSKIDDIPSNRVNEKLNKSLAPSPSTKH